MTCEGQVLYRCDVYRANAPPRCLPAPRLCIFYVVLLACGMSQNFCAIEAGRSTSAVHYEQSLSPPLPSLSRTAAPRTLGARVSKSMEFFLGGMFFILGPLAMKIFASVPAVVVCFLLTFFTLTGVLHKSLLGRVLLAEVVALRDVPGFLQQCVDASSTPPTIEFVCSQYKVSGQGLDASYRRDLDVH